MKDFNIEQLAKDIPRKFLKKDNYYTTHYNNAKKEYEKFISLTKENKRKLFEKTVKNGIAYSTKTIENIKQTNIRINNMIGEIKKWKLPKPNSDYVNFRDFMIEQLSSSLDDNDYIIIDYHEKNIARLKALKFKNWETEEKTKLKKTLDRAEKDMERFEENNSKSAIWIEELFKSIPKE